MRRILSVGFLSAAAALVMGASPVAAQQGQFRVGVVNSQRVLAGLPALANAQRTLEGELGRYRTEVDTLESSLQRRQQALQQNTSLTPAARTQQQQALQQSVNQYQQRVQQLQQQAQQREQQLVAPVMQQVQTAIENVRRQQGLSLILDSANPGLIAFDPAIDITNAVFTALGVTPPPAGAAPVGPARPVAPAAPAVPARP